MKRDVLLLDLGSYEIKGMFYDEKSNAVVTYKEKNTGISNGYLVDVFLFQTCVLNIIKYIENKVDKKIEHVSILVSGVLLNYKMLHIKKFKINGVINQHKIDLINQHIMSWVNERQSVLLKSFPVEYVLDGAVIDNPYGLYVELFSFKYFVCYAAKTKLNNLIHVLEQLNLTVREVIPSIFLLGDRYLSNDEKQLGALLFDIGDSKMHWIYYYKGVPYNAGNINLGSNKITNKLASGLRIHLAEARDIKHEYLSACLKPDHFCSWVKVQHEMNEDFILQAEVIRKILPEITEFVESIKKILEAFTKTQKAFYIVFCGNGAYLNDLVEVLQKTSSLNIQTINKDDIFGVSEIYFKRTSSKNVSNAFVRIIKTVYDYFF